ncbi:MAG: N-acetylmuramoyl-L-alanine amidase [Phycisphaerae bacterium]
MQRIAFIAGVLIALWLTGCASQEKTARPRPIPEPLVQIRPPPPPPRQQPMIAIRPQPKPAPMPVAPSSADWTPPGGINRGKWRTIVVHHAASATATPQGMNDWHKQRGWENGLGYHFVIGNGVNYGDGEVYVGPRWRKQQTGAHCKSGSGMFFGVFRPSNFFNERGVGICLIGNFQTGRATPAQLASLKALTRFICGETGIRAGQIYGHGEVTGATECPGRNLNMGLVRRNAGDSNAAAVPRGFGRFGEWLDADRLGRYADFAATAYRYLYRPVLALHRLAEPVDVADARLLDTLDHVADLNLAGDGAVVLDFEYDHADCVAVDQQPFAGFGR